jgi:hypothetical protein
VPSTIAWLPSVHEGVLEVEPHVDGRGLVSLVTDFETSQGFTPEGGYGGLVLFGFGDLNAYFRGEREPWGGQVILLGCDCGEWGCWPQRAQVTLRGSTASWTDFAQPHRPERDYSRFGPFEFDADDYLAAVDEVAALVSR